MWAGERDHVEWGYISATKLRHRESVNMKHYPVVDAAEAVFGSRKNAERIECSWSSMKI